MSYELFNLKIISVRYMNNHIKNHITLILGKNQDNKCHISVFGSVVAVAFQSVFHSKMYQNNIFFIFLKSFLTSAHQMNLKIPEKY